MTFSFRANPKNSGSAFGRIQSLALLSILLLGVLAVAALFAPMADAATNTLAVMNPNPRSAGLPSALPSATVFVTNTNDSGVGSLRSVAISASPDDTINFNLSGCPCTITLGSEIAITQSLNIVGLGQTMLAVSGGGTTRVFNIMNGGGVTLSNFTIRDGKATAANGGGLRTQYPLTLTNMTLTANTVTSTFNGGAIYIEAGGAVMVINSTITGNSAYLGGGIANYFGSVTVLSSTIASNNGSSEGGAIYERDGPVTIVNSTIYNNSSDVGGAIMEEFSGVVNIYNSTIVSNTVTSCCAAFFAVSGATLALTNTIVAYPNAPKTNCAGVLPTNGGHNIDSGTSCGWGSGNFSMSSTNPLVGNLADNGGPTQTAALLPGSPAIDAGDNTTCAAAPVNGRDQRGFLRLGNCDIGAYEIVKMIFLPLIFR